MTEKQMAEKQWENPDTGMGFPVVVCDWVLLVTQPLMRRKQYRNEVYL